MNVVLNLSSDGRVLSAGYYARPPEGAVMIDEALLPTGDLTAYRYVDGAFVYDPLPEEEAQPAPTTQERLDALELAGLEHDAALMELAAMLTGGDA